MLTLRAGAAARAAALALSCALALLVAAPRVACAQGTSGAFADPLSVGELKMLLEQRAEIPAGVWPQIQSAHDAYLRRAEEFRNGDIERFQKKSRSAMSGQGDMQAQIAQWQSMMRDYSDLARKSDGIDDELFAAVAKVLEASPEAAAAVEGAKLARRRQAMRTGFGRAMMSPSVMADVEQVAYDLSVPEPARAPLRQALAGYGAKQTPALREYGDRMQQMYLEFMKAQMGAMQAAGEAAAEGEAAGMQLDQGASQAVWARLGPEVVRQRKQLLSNNRESARAAREALAGHPEVQQRFADQWIVASYPGIPDSESTGVPQAGRRALRLRSLDDAARASLKQALADWRTADDAILAEWSSATDDFEAATTAWTFDDAAFRAFNERVTEFQRRRSERATQALNAIDAAVGGEMSGIVRGTDFSRDGELMEPEREDASGAVAPAGASSAGDPKAKISEFFQRTQRTAVAAWSLPIGAEDAARIAAAMGADGGQRAIIESLASDHSEGWAARIAPIFAEAKVRMMQVTTPEEAAPLMKDLADSFDAARVQRDALDAQFFDGLAAVASGPDAARIVASLKQLREIDGAAHDDAAMMRMTHMVPPARVRIDPLEGVWALVPADKRAELAALVEARLPAAMQAAKELGSAALAVRAVEDRMRAMTPDMPEAEQAAVYAESGRAFSQSAKARESLRAAEGAIADAALALLADDARARIRLTRTRMQHPEYFRDDPVRRAYDRALALEGIDDAMRTSIAAALAEYLSARDASESALVLAVGERTDYPLFDAETPEAQARFAKQYEAWMLGNEKVERALYIRRGGRERALVTLSGILGPERTRLAGVPDAAELAREELRLRDESGADSGE